MSSNSWVEAFRFLEDENDDDVGERYGVEVYTVGRPDDDQFESEYDDDDEYYLEPWGWTLITVAGAFIIAACIFYFTWKYHIFAAKTDADDVEELNSVSVKQVATKKFDGQSHHHPAVHSVGSEATEPSDAPAIVALGSHPNFHNLATAPRCVLCSKAYVIGENVTQSAACHHEYHEHCLIKYWKRSQDNNGRCPVCKLGYDVEDLAPSRQFTTGTA